MTIAGVSSMIKPIIQVSHLTKKFLIKTKTIGFVESIKSLFKPRYKEIIAVDSISFDVLPGEIIAFIGPNGAGKSTTIKMLTGILFPSSGSIKVLGLTPSTDRTQLAYHIGSVFGQKSQLWYHLPPLDSYKLFAHLYEIDPQEFKRRLQFLLEVFEIRDLITIPVRRLSLGQRMKCEIVGSLLHKPEIIFLDEPTIGLDVIAKQQVREVIKHLHEEEKTTIFLTSHDAGDIETLTKRTIIINHGVIIYDGQTQTLKKDYLTHKIVEFVLKDEITNFDFSQGTILEINKHHIKIEIDASPQTIEQLLSYVSEHFTILDITITDQPLEEIIASIYKKPRIKEVR